MKEGRAMDKNITNIAVGLISHHPKNPRLEIGDLTELADSIRAHGVMQNLTVMPAGDLEEGAEGYIALIGHRRLEAAKLAGLETVPCSIVTGLSENEQVSIMLLENMQRTDLTVYEQAQGFQMMLDLGDTEDSIAEKTGFSKTTVRHRLNIAKLDKEVLKEKENSGEFQLAIKDLVALEKVKDIDKRNEILREADDPRELAYKIEAEVRAERRERNAEMIGGLMEKAGIPKAPKGTEKERWNGTWDTIEEYDLEDELPDSISIAGLKDGKIKGKEAFYVAWNYERTIAVITKKAGTDKKERELTEEGLLRKQIDKNKKEIKARFKAQNAKREDFVMGIITGAIEPLKDEGAMAEKLWNYLINNDVYMSRRNLVPFFSDKDFYELGEDGRASVYRAIGRTSMAAQLLALTVGSLKEKDPAGWNGEYKPHIKDLVDTVDGFLGEYGFCGIDDEDREIIDGTSPLYTEPEESEDEDG
mgnify:CR=1 FL=1